MESNQAIIYNNGEIELNVSIKEDTIWLTQKQIAELFEVKIPAISKHIKNIFIQNELNKFSTISKMETVQKEGNREVSRDVEHYNLDSKSDLFAVFMERGFETIKANAYMAMITMQSWMFLSSYEKLREKIIKHHHIDTMVHLGARAFEEIGGEVVQSVAFVLQKGISAK